MAYYLVKVAVTTVLIVAISEIARRSTMIGAILASIPLISVIAIIWLYVDTKDVGRISMLSQSIFWLVLPSLALFVSLPLLLKQGLNFYLSISIAIGLTVLCYWLLITLLTHLGVEL